MFKNYILTTLRNISRRKGFSILNVLGLSIGLAASLLIMQYVKDEFSYDDFHANKENIYRVQYDRYRDNELVLQCATTFPKVAPALLADYPEVQKACRLYLRYGGGVIRYDDIQMKEDNLFTADQSFFDIFSYPLLSGDRATALKEPNTAVVEEETARKYFGDADPIGRELVTGFGRPERVVGVVTDVAEGNLTDDAARVHDAHLNDREWVRNIWSPVPDGVILNGPVVITNFVLGAIPFWLHNEISSKPDILRR